MNNTAATYGANIACFPRELVSFPDADTYEKYYNESSAQLIIVNKTLTSYSFTNV